MNAGDVSIEDEITVVVIPEGVTEIGELAFNNCTSLKEITIPDSVTEIGEFAFEYCKSLKEITIPDSVTKIGDYAFSDCTSLKEITIPDSVTEIGYGVFSGCTSLKEVTIPDSVIWIGEDAFSDCEFLEKINYRGLQIKGQNLNFISSLSDGLVTMKCILIAAKEHKILKDDCFSPVLAVKLINAMHNGREAFEKEAAEIAENFQLIGFYDISSKVDVEAKQKLIRLFKEPTPAPAPQAPAAY
ncbi:MAG: leucine-rich repeat domain-containing protein [Lachnospiraceae bacterium]|nr:MAG: leucine-rich repeat domain-containing protein [Lachnospiraceae bacterium]